MADIIDFEKAKEGKGEDEDTILVCCSECGGVLFAAMLYKGSLIFECAHEPCGEVYLINELQEAE